VPGIRISNTKASTKPSAALALAPATYLARLRL
jgi:hypothetical protein